MADKKKPDEAVTPMEAQNAYQAHETEPEDRPKPKPETPRQDAEEYESERIPTGGETALRDDL